MSGCSVEWTQVQGLYLGDVQMAGSLQVASTRLFCSHSWGFSRGCCILASLGSALHISAGTRCVIIFDFSRILCLYRMQSWQVFIGVVWGWLLFLISSPFSYKVIQISLKTSASAFNSASLIFKGLIQAALPRPSIARQIHCFKCIFGDLQATNWSGLYFWLSLWFS